MPTLHSIHRAIHKRRQVEERRAILRMLRDGQIAAARLPPQHADLPAVLAELGVEPPAPGVPGIRDIALRGD